MNSMCTAPTIVQSTATRPLSATGRKFSNVATAEDGGEERVDAPAAEGAAVGHRHLLPGGGLARVLVEDLNVAADPFHARVQREHHLEAGDQGEQRHQRERRKGNDGAGQRQCRPGGEANDHNPVPCGASLADGVAQRFIFFEFTRVHMGVLLLEPITGA